MSMIYRINSGEIPGDSWIQDKEIGGGRIIGEVCHFIDYLTFMCDSLPQSVYASTMSDPNNFQDNVVINLRFVNGSVGSICYFANGGKTLPKEYIEVYQHGLTGIINDFKILETFNHAKRDQHKLMNQDKGQSKMLQTFLDRVKTGGEPVISPMEIFKAMQTTFGALESIQSGKAISL